MVTTSERGRAFRAIVSGDAFPDLQSRADGAGHDPDAPPEDRGVDAASRNFKRPPFVAAVFQVSKDSVEDQFLVIKARDIFAKHPKGAGSLDEAKHVWPEETVIAIASTLPGKGEGLTGEAAREDREVFRETGELGGEAKSADPSEQV